MKFFLVLALAMRLITAQSLSDIPSCAQDCIPSVVTSVTPCQSIQDHTCICDHAQEILDTASPCILTLCGADVVTGPFLRFCIAVEAGASVSDTLPSTALPAESVMSSSSSSTTTTSLAAWSTTSSMASSTTSPTPSALASSAMDGIGATIPPISASSAAKTSPPIVTSPSNATVTIFRPSSSTSTSLPVVTVLTAGVAVINPVHSGALLAAAVGAILIFEA